jgi:stearoyl-CoA desaturase (delta-9 desaturase)
MSVRLNNMSRSSKIINLAGVVLPFAAVITAIVFLWNSLVGPSDLFILLGFYLLTGMGITVGFHRLFTHRSFQTYRPIQYAFAVLGTMALQGSVITWVADHRKHHAHTDEEGDPHSPHLSGGGVRGAVQGLYYAHMGWLFQQVGEADKAKYAPDLVDDPGMNRINRFYLWWIAASMALPGLLGLLITGTFFGAFTGVLWGGLVRIFLLHHVTWSINSVCHFFGRRRFATDDYSTNVFWLSLLSFGESWHHNHHAFPRSAFHGLRGWELDPGGWIIRGLKRTRLAWDVVEITPERQQARLASGSA